MCDVCAEGLEHGLGCGFTRSTGSAGAYAFSVEAECSLCIRFQLLTAFREARLVLQGAPPDLPCARSFISPLSGSLSEIETNRPQGSKKCYGVSRNISSQKLWPVHKETALSVLYNCWLLAGLETGKSYEVERQ